MEYTRCYTEISLDSIVHNIRESKKFIESKTRVLAVIKADAYGHGAAKVAKALEQEADCFAVATIEEGIALRQSGITHPILLLSYTDSSQYDALIEADLTACLFSLADAKKLSECAGKHNQIVKAHIALDTGMSRIGFLASEAEHTIREIKAICSLDRHLVIEGMFSHFACADMEDISYSLRQKELFEKIRSALEASGVHIPVCHLCNSAGVMEFQDARYQMVRIGITMYGCYPSDEVHKERMDLRPALAWKCHVIHVKEVEQGTGISYGATYTTSREKTRIATLSVGYADGYPRALSGKGRVIINGCYAPILGRVCMDQMMVDVTDIPDAAPGDIVTLIGRDQEAVITVEELADAACRFNYEMLCNISQNTNRVKRVYI